MKHFANMKKVVFLYLYAVAFLLGACSQSEKSVTPAFYHWKTKLALSDSEIQTWRNLQAKKLYVKFFDIDLDAKNKPIPLATLQCDHQLSDSIEIIPTIFITNRTLKALALPEMKELSQRILLKINAVSSSVSNNTINEIQFDCDWTPSTKEKYFTFLQYFKSELQRKNQAHCLLSATIRLHQIKYPKETGVPPVDRGMLMFYNMDDLENIKTKNSILNLEVAEQYLQENTKYDLPLDMALPIFRWGVLFRNGKMIKLINNLHASDLKNNHRFSNLSENRYTVVESTYLKGYYLYASDVIRLEGISSDELLSSARFLNSAFSDDEITVAMYQLDTSTIKYYSDEILQQTFKEFSR